MSSLSDIRADFIRRLFAVAVSVGFAATLVQMAWVKNGSFPKVEEWEQLAILLTGMIATVLSWDGYLASIEAKPLIGRARYIIDIALVFIYMFFLISSSKFHLWLPILASMFVLYCVWDFLTVREHIGKYDASLQPTGTGNDYRAPVRDVLRVYGRAACNSESTSRGTIITLSWTMLFIALAAINLFRSHSQVFVMSAFADVGLILYRRDKTILPDGSAVSGYTMGYRSILILCLVAFAALYACAFGD